MNPENQRFSPFDHARDVALPDDQVLLAVQLDVISRVFAEQNPISGRNFQRHQPLFWLGVHLRILSKRDSSMAKERCPNCGQQSLEVRRRPHGTAVSLRAHEDASGRGCGWKGWRHIDDKPRETWEWTRGA